MKALTVVGLAVLAGVAVAGGVVAMSAFGPSIKAVDSVRDVVPDDVLFYAECENLAGVMKSMRGTEAWVDLQASPIVQDPSSGLHGLLETLNEISNKIDYELDEPNLMKFFGEGVGVAMRVDPIGLDVQWALVTRLDMPALTRDFISGKLDSRKLQLELQSRSEKADFSVTTTTVGDYSIAALTRGDDTYHATILEDVLVVTDDPSLARSIVALRQAGSGSLSDNAAFQAELARLPDGTTWFDWTNIAQVVEQRDLLKQAWNSRRRTSQEDTKVPKWPFDLLIDAVDQCPSLARSWRVPDGDLYHAEWVYSRTAEELFNDATVGDVSVVASGDPMFYWDMRNVGEVATAWETSDLRKRLADSALGRWSDELFDDPFAKARTGLAALPGGMDPVGSALDEASFEGSLTFTNRFASGLFLRQAPTFFQGSAAMAIDVHEGFDAADVEMTLAVRLGVDMRAIVLIVMGAAANDADGSWELAETVAGRPVLRRALDPNSGADPVRVETAVVGDLWLLSTSRPRLEATVKSLDVPTPQRPPVVDALNATDPDRHMGMYVDYERVTGRLEKALAEMRPGAASEDFNALTKGVLSHSMTCRVDEKFASIEWRVRVSADPDLDEKGTWLSLLREGAGTSGMMVPEGALMFTATHGSLSGMFDILRGVELLKLDESLKAGDEELGLSIANDLIPALGPELAFTAIGNHERADPEMPPVPNLAFFVQVTDRAPVLKTLEQLASTFEETAAQNADGRAGPPMQLFREQLATGEMLTLDLGGAMGPMRPSFGMVGDFLAITSNDAGFRAASAGSLAGQPGGWTKSAAAKDASAHFEPPFVQAGFVDWRAVVDQLEEYVPEMSGAFARTDYSDAPEDPSAAEWNAYMERKEAERVANAANAEAETREWLDVLRVLRYMAWSSRRDGASTTTSMQLGF